MLAKRSAKRLAVAAHLVLVKLTDAQRWHAEELGEKAGSVGTCVLAALWLYLLGEWMGEGCSVSPVGGSGVSWQHSRSDKAG